MYGFIRPASKWLGIGSEQIKRKSFAFSQRNSGAKRVKLQVEGRGEIKKLETKCKRGAKAESLRIAGKEQTVDGSAQKGN